MDDSDPVPSAQHARGYGGTSVFWNQNINHLVKPVPDGGHRIAVVEVLTTPRPMCLLNVYLPSRGSGSSDTEFREVLDEIHEIMQV